MKATVIEQGHLVEREVPLPERKPGEVLVRVKMSGVNRADVMQVDGNYPPPPGSPPWPGLEISGVVEDGGENRRWKPGDRVMALLPGGGYGRFVSVPEGMLLPVPEGMSMSIAAGIPEIFATAYLNLAEVGQARPGETLYMPGANSGLAGAVIPLGKQMGLRVITSARSEEKILAVRHLPFDRIVNTAKENLADVFREEEALGHPVSIAIDCLAGEDLSLCLPYVAYGCRWIVIAALRGNPKELPMTALFKKNIRLMGSTLRSKPVEVKEKVLSALEEKVFPLFRSGKILLPEPTVFPIREADGAHLLLRQGKNVGKIVLKQGEE